MFSHCQKALVWIVAVAVAAGGCLWSGLPLVAEKNTMTKSIL